MDLDREKAHCFGKFIKGKFKSQFSNSLKLQASGGHWQSVIRISIQECGSESQHRLKNIFFNLWSQFQY
jgi:hypothetical protein